MLARAADADGPEPTEEQNDAAAWVDMSFLILRSTTDYQDARRFVDRAARTLHVAVRRLDLVSNAKLGLTFDRKVCTEESDGYPCYWPRGRDESGVWLSIEFSSGYQGFKPGLYLVLLQHAFPSEHADIQATLERAKKHFPSAYIKKTQVYMGCMH